MLRSLFRPRLLAAALVVAAAACGDDDSSTGTSSTPSAITATAGAGQTVVAGGIANPFSVKVTNASGTAVAGVAVTWAITSGGGSLSTTSTSTDASGVASTTYTAARTAGPATVTATVAGLAAVTFTTTVTSGSVGTNLNLIAIASGNGQTVTASRAASPFVVRVTNAAGAAVSGETVTFAITAGGGSLSATTATTDASGNASTTYTAGGAAGAATVKASLTNGPSVTFTSTIASGSTGTVDSTTAKVIAAIDAFKATLSTTQVATFQIALTQTNASRWSNLPVSTQTSRNGLQLGALSTTQLTAAIAVVRAILSDTGYATFQGIRAADDYLRANGGGTSYGAGLYHLAVLGTPSTSSHWVLQLGGHHYALNAAFNGPGAPKVIVTGSPFFMGVEPIRFTLNGVNYAPMQSRQTTIYSMINSLDATQKATALLSGRFDDLLAGANGDGKFATTQQGIAGSALTAAQRTLVSNAIRAWVQDLTPAAANALMADYGADSSLTRTYISYATSSDSTVQGSYVRIDGPRVWVEFSVQRGAVFQSSIHYHAIWRDKVRDYGGTISTASVQQVAFGRQVEAARYRLTPTAPVQAWFAAAR